MTGLLTLRHLAFTGPDVVAAGLAFNDGLNILYGASNTGKSFAVEALNFMFGASTPPSGIDEAAPYDQAWLGLRLPDGVEVTLSRALAGHGFLVHPGLVTASAGGAFPLAPEHDAKSATNLSMYLLNLIGFGRRELVKNANGEKNTLSFRDLAPYLFTSEESIIAKQSPILVT